MPIYIILWNIIYLHKPAAGRFVVRALLNDTCKLLFWDKNGIVARGLSIKVACLCLLGSVLPKTGKVLLQFTELCWGQNGKFRGRGPGIRGWVQDILHSTGMIRACSSAPQPSVCTKSPVQKNHNILFALPEQNPCFLPVRF